MPGRNAKLYLHYFVNQRKNPAPKALPVSGNFKQEQKLP
jgi:hypothetical protein